MNINMDIGQSSDVHTNAGEDEGETVEIKIKTLDAQSYSLRVNRNTPVPALKDQIASVVGVPVENQRLICRGKVLKDDQLLGAYSIPIFRSYFVPSVLYSFFVNLTEGLGPF